MSTRPWMPMYWQDFIMDTLDLRADELGTYFIMLLLAWRREEAGLPNDMDMLKRSLQACSRDFHGHTFNRIVPKILDRYWQLDADNIWRNKRLTKERQKADKLSAKQKQNAEKRWSTSKENNNLDHAGAMPSQSQSQSQSHKKEEESKREARGTRLSSDWVPSPTNLNEAAKIGLSDLEINHQAEEFRDYWFARAGPGGVKRDWDATWRRWCRKFVESRGTLNGKGKGVGDDRERRKSASEQALEKLRRFANGDVCESPVRLLSYPRVVGESGNISDGSD